MISVIIPSYNRAELVLRSAKSVLAQTVTDLELIVVDDGSSDDTLKRLKEIDDNRMKVLVHETNKGACAARNTGIRAAVGDYIAFQDSDDEWRPNKLEKQLAFLESTGGDVCFCKMERHGYKKGNARFYPDLPAGDVSYDLLLANSLVSTQVIFAKRKVFEDCLFDEKVKRRQDYDWVVRAGKNNRFVFTDEVLVDTYYQQDSITGRMFSKSEETYEYLIKKDEDMFEDQPDFKAHLYYQYAISRYINKKSGAKELGIAAEANRKYKKLALFGKAGILRFYFFIRPLIKGK